MARVPVYQRQQSIPGTTGQQYASMSLAGENNMAQLTGAVSEVAGELQAAGKRIQRRQDKIAKSRAKDAYEAEALQNYTAFLDGEDILAKGTLEKFVSESEARLSQTLAGFQGSAEARADLEADLWSSHSAYKMDLIRKKNTAEREYIGGKINEAIAPVVSDLTKNPGNITAAFKQIDKIVKDNEDLLGTMDEMKVRDQAYSLAMEKTIGGLMMSPGGWRQADKMLQDNPLLAKHLSPSKREMFEREIRQFAADEGKLRREMQTRASIVSDMRDMGHNIDNDKAMNFVIGADISPDKSFGQEIDDKLRGIGISPSTATLQERAAVAGIKLPKSVDIDPNKDYYIDNGVQKLTAQGVSKQTKPYIESAVAIRGQLDTIDGLLSAYENGNAQAGLGIVQAYLKMIDDGAVVREADINLANQSADAKARLESAINSLSKGEVVADTVVRQAVQAAQAFSARGLELSKGFIDDYRADSNYRLIDIGIPQGRYERIFDGIKDIKPPQQTKPKTDPNVTQVPETATPQNADFSVGIDGSVTPIGAPDVEALPRPTKERKKRRENKDGT